MSYLPQSEENQNAPQGQTSPNPGGMPPPTQATGGSSGAGSTAPKAGSAPSSGTPTQFGSSASKLGDYLTANAPQITNQANTIAGQLNNQYGQVGTDITNAANQFGQQVQGGYTAPNQDIVNQAVANPTQFAQDPNNISGFQAQYNDAYKGPANYESTSPYSNIQSEVNNAVQGAQALNTQGGLQNYFASTGPNQTKASNTLDSLLVQGNPDAQKTVKTAADQYSNLTPQFNQSVTAANAQVPLAQQAAANASQYAKGQFDPYAQNFSNQLTQGANAAEAGRTAYNTQQLANYNQLTPIQQYLQQYQGATGQTLDNPLTPYLNQKPVTGAIDINNYSTPEQYAQANALQQISGGSYQSPLDQGQIAQAGTAGTPGQLMNPNMQAISDQIAKQAATQSLLQAHPNMALDQLLAASNNKTPALGGNVYNPPAIQTLLSQLQQYDPNIVNAQLPTGIAVPGQYNYNFGQ